MEWNGNNGGRINDTVKPEAQRRARRHHPIINAAPGRGAGRWPSPSCGVCLMHMHGDPHDHAGAAHEGDVVPQVLAVSCVERLQSLAQRGVLKKRICSTRASAVRRREPTSRCWHARKNCWTSGYALLAGWSRKSSLGVVTGRPSSSA